MGKSKRATKGRPRISDRVRSTTHTCVGEEGTVVDTFSHGHGKGPIYYAIAFDGRDTGAVYKTANTFEVLRTHE